MELASEKKTVLGGYVNPNPHTNHLPKIVANRPGLATLRCTMCGRKWLFEYKDSKGLDALKQTIKFVRRPRAFPDGMLTPRSA